MAKGFGFAGRASAEIAARSGGGSLFGGKLIFKLEDQEDAIVRFLPDDDGEYVHCAWHHEVPVEGRAWGDQVPCIAQDEEMGHTEDPCPGCEADLKFKYKGYIKLVWHDAPVYKRDDKGKVVKDNQGDLVVVDHKDQVAIWSSGPRLFEELEETEDAYGLGSRNFRVKRKGIKKDTKYTIVPENPDGGKKAMSAGDKKLAKEDETDLSEFVLPPSYEEWEMRLSGQTVGAGQEVEPAQDQRKKNPFNRAAK